MMRLQQYTKGRRSRSRMRVRSGSHCGEVSRAEAESEIRATVTICGNNLHGR
jgi:hypothetical protein